MEFGYPILDKEFCKFKSSLMEIEKGQFVYASASGKVIHLTKTSITIDYGDGFIFKYLNMPNGKNLVKIFADVTVNTKIWDTTTNEGWFYVKVSKNGKNCKMKKFQQTLEIDL